MLPTKKMASRSCLYQIDRMNNAIAQQEISCPEILHQASYHHYTVDKASRHAFIPELSNHLFGTFFLLSIAKKKTPGPSSCGSRWCSGCASGARPSPPEVSRTPRGAQQWQHHQQHHQNYEQAITQILPNKLYRHYSFASGQFALLHVLLGEPKSSHPPIRGVIPARPAHNLGG